MPNAQESMKVSGDDIFGLFETQIHLHKDPMGPINNGEIMAI